MADSYGLLRRQGFEDQVRRTKFYNRPMVFKPLWVWHDEEEKLISGLLDGFTLNLCSGFSTLGDVCVDLYMDCDVQADMSRLPFRAKAFTTTVFDPPWKLGPHNFPQFRQTCREVERVTAKRIILRCGSWIWNFEPLFSLTQAWLIKRFSPQALHILVWERVQDGLDA